MKQDLVQRRLEFNERWFLYCLPGGWRQNYNHGLFMAADKHLPLMIAHDWCGCKTWLVVVWWKALDSRQHSHRHPELARAKKKKKETRCIKAENSVWPQIWRHSLGLPPSDGGDTACAMSSPAGTELIEDANRSNYCSNWADWEA